MSSERTRRAASLRPWRRAKAISRDVEFGKQFLIRRADRLMFGTDYLSPGQEVPQLTLFRQLQLPADVQDKIFRDNARSLLRLSANGT